MLQGQRCAVFNLSQAKVVVGLNKSDIHRFLPQLQPQHGAVIQQLLCMKIYCTITTPVPLSFPIAGINLLNNNEPWWSRQTPQANLQHTISTIERKILGQHLQDHTSNIESYGWHNVAKPLFQTKPNQLLAKLEQIHLRLAYLQDKKLGDRIKRTKKPGNKTAKIQKMHPPKK
jgi:hypothetical protein